MNISTLSTLGVLRKKADTSRGRRKCNKDENDVTAASGITRVVYHDYATFPW